MPFFMPIEENIRKKNLKKFKKPIYLVLFIFLKTVILIFVIPIEIKVMKRRKKF